MERHCLSREAVSRATKIKALPAAQLQSQPDARRNKESISLKEEEFVAAVYSEDCQVYIGKVLEVDEDDTLISFMHHGNSKPLDSNSVLKWPRQSDEVWINRDDVLCLIPEPVSLKITGSREGCKLQDGVFTKVLSLYRKWKKAKRSKK